MIRFINIGILTGQTVPRPAPSWVLENLSEVEVRQSDDDGDYRQGFQLRFAAVRGAAKRSEYRLLTESLLAPGHRVVLTVDLNRKMYVLLDGIVTHHQLVFPDVHGDAILAVTGRDLSELMDIEDHCRVHKNQKHAQVVRTILVKYANRGIRADVTAPKVEWPVSNPPHSPTQTGTDRQYLRDLAKANGYIFYVTPDRTPGASVAYWGPPKWKTSALPALTVNMGAATNVEKLNFQQDGGRPSKVNASVHKADQPQPAQVSITRSKRADKLSLERALETGGALVRTMQYAYTGPDRNEAQARAQAMTDQSTDQVVVATGELDAMIYGGILKAPASVGVRGVGEHYDGYYYVRSVRHKINLGVYRQEFVLTREGTRSTVQRVTV